MILPKIVSEKFDKALKLLNESNISSVSGARVSGSYITKKRFSGSEYQMKLSINDESPDTYKFTVANTIS